MTEVQLEGVVRKSQVGKDNRLSNVAHVQHLPSPRRWPSFKCAPWCAFALVVGMAVFQMGTMVPIYLRQREHPDGT